MFLIFEAGLHMFYSYFLSTLVPITLVPLDTISQPIVPVGRVPRRRRRSSWFKIRIILWVNILYITHARSTKLMTANTDRDHIFGNEHGPIPPIS